MGVTARALSGAFLVLCVALLGVAAGSVAMGGSSQAAPAADVAAEPGAGPGAVLWRGGDAAGAVEQWTAALDSAVDTPDAERARLAYNLGVAAFGADEPLRAVAWFSAALEHSPRHADAAFNLEIARAEAGLAPRASDDLTGATLGFLASFTRAESWWFALAGVVLLALGCALEALRGGGWRRLLVAVMLAQPLFFAPLLRHALEPEGLPVMVVARAGTSLFAVPAPSAARVGSLDGGDVVRRLDALPGWTKVRSGGEERWIRTGDVIPLRWPVGDARALSN